MPSMVPANPAPLPAWAQRAPYAGTDWSRLGSGTVGSVEDYLNAFARMYHLNSANDVPYANLLRQAWTRVGGDPNKFLEEANYIYGAAGANIDGNRIGFPKDLKFNWAQAPGFTQASTPSNYGAGWRGGAFGPSGRLNAYGGTDVNAPAPLPAPTPTPAEPPPTEPVVDPFDAIYTDFVSKAGWSPEIAARDKGMVKTMWDMAGGNADAFWKMAQALMPSNIPIVPSNAGGPAVPGGFTGQPAPNAATTGATAAVAPQQAAIANWWQQVQNPGPWARPNPTPPTPPTTQASLPETYTGLPTYTNPWAIQKPKTYPKPWG